VPDGRLGLVKVLDPPSEVVVARELGESGVRPAFTGDALGKHYPGHALQVPPADIAPGTVPGFDEWASPVLTT
jgi:hypothetical protein